MSDDGYMNEKHMGVVERTRLGLSESRQKLRDAAGEFVADDAKPHLVEALRAADRDAELVYKRLFQGTYFHVPEDQLTNASAAPATDASSSRAKKRHEVA